MAYKKPQIIAKSEAKQSFVAGCGLKDSMSYNCGSVNYNCQVVGVR